MADCPITADVNDVEERLEHQILDWMLDLKNNMGLLTNLEDVYLESTIVANNDISEASMYSMADEIARIKYTAKPLYTTAVGHKNNIDAKLIAQCDARDTHANIRDEWLTHRDNLDPLDPDYATDYSNATSQANTAESHRQTKQDEIDELRTDANSIIGQLNTQFTQLVTGTLASRYDCNISVGSLVEEDVQPEADADYIVGEYKLNNDNQEIITNSGYALTVLNKIGKWAEFAQSLDITTKLKSITFNHGVPNGSGSLSDTIDALSARDADFNEDGELEVASEMDYKAPIIAAYGPEIIAAASNCKSDIVAEYNFLQDVLITSVTGDTVTYSSGSNGWTKTSSVTFQPESWYDARNAELDVLPDPYDPEVPNFIARP